MKLSSKLFQQIISLLLLLMNFLNVEESLVLPTDNE